MERLTIKFNEEVIEWETLRFRFERYLKREAGIYSEPGAKNTRNLIIAQVEEFVFRKAKEIRPLSMEALYDEVKQIAEQFGGEELIKTLTTRRRAIPLFFKFLESNGYKPKEAEITEEKKVEEPAGAVEIGEEEVEAPIRQRQAIGRVAPTMKSPAKPSEFTFWVSEDEERRRFPIEPGRLVSASNGQVAVIGIISDVETQTDITSPVESFYGHAVGDPDKDMPTEPIVITTATVEVIHRSDNKAEPITGQWKVYPADGEEIVQAYGRELRDEDELIIGFSYDWEGKPVPIPANIRHILGYEAAHVNISGAAGAATKTSYALFLIFSILAYYQKFPDKDIKPAAIVFNVKEADLLRIDQLPDWDKDIEPKAHGGPYKDSASLWKFLLKEIEEPYSINPYKLKERIRFWVPQDSRGNYITLRPSSFPMEGFRYCALDLAETRSLHLLLDPEDLDDKSMAVIASLTDEIREKKKTFEEAIDVLKFQRRPTKGEEGWIPIGDTYHHSATVFKVRNRLENAIKYQLADFLMLKELTLKRVIKIWELRPGDLWVIDISRLHDKGQRLIFHWIMRAIYDFLEKKRVKQEKTKFLGDAVDVNLTEFPNRVVIFVDEMNKFAPRGAGASLIKRDVVEIAARGRSVGLSLIGAQQLASKVDEEILANTSTLVVGRSHPVEIRRETYDWLPRGLKSRATTLDRGWMIVWHGAHKRPVFIHFPEPLHSLYEKIRRQE